MKEATKKLGKCNMACGTLNGLLRQMVVVMVGFLCALSLALLDTGEVQAQAFRQPVKIGVLGDMSGPWADMGGPGSTEAAKMAIEDCLEKECKGMKIELLTADHQNKPDIAVSKAREWADVDKVGAFADLTNSAVSLAVFKLSKEMNFVPLASGPATTRLTNEDCSPTGFHWMFDTYALAAGTAKAILKIGGKSWYFVTVDYAFGHQLEKDAIEMVKEYGGTVVGTIRHPLNAPDFSSFMLSAQSSGAQVIGLANAGPDAVNAIKTATEFGLSKTQIVAPLLLFFSDVRSAGLELAQGVTLSTGFYWDMDDQTRAWSVRFMKRYKNLKPTMTHGGVYSSVYHYLKAVAQAKTTDAKVVAATMRMVPIKDPIMRNASIRPDGRVIHDFYLMKTKSPSESKYDGDYYKLVATIPAADAFQPLSKSKCYLIKK
jgi:branched-chain amino acid transport system substrate-binding protein